MYNFLMSFLFFSFLFYLRSSAEIDPVLLLWLVGLRGLAGRLLRLHPEQMPLQTGLSRYRHSQLLQR